MCDPCCMPCCGPCPDLHRCKSRELRASILYTACDCIKRNGLQSDCPRSECQGKPCCMTKPNPSCHPACFASRYVNITMGGNKPSSSHGCGDKSSICYPGRSGFGGGLMQECDPIVLPQICYPCGPSGPSGPIPCMPCGPPSSCGPCPPCSPCGNNPYDPTNPCAPCGPPCLPCGPCGPCGPNAPCLPYVPCT